MKKFKVFSSKTHRQLFTMLALLFLSLLYVASVTGYPWMYIVSLITLGILLAVWHFLHLFVIFTPEGIRLKRGFVCIREMQWPDILCCGRFSLRVLGSDHMESYLYFSRKPVNYGALVSSKVLPKQTEDFLFMSVQPDILAAIDSCWLDPKKKNVLTMADTAPN